MTNSPVLKVAVNVPLTREFDYLPAAGETVPAPGCRVLVPFGRRRQTGLVLARAADSAVPVPKLRRAVRVLDAEPLLSADDLWLLRFTSNYYHHPIGEVMAAALPALLRQGRELYPALVHVAATDAGAAADLDALARRAPRQAELLQTLLDSGASGLDTETLAGQLPNWRRAAKPLAAKGLISEHATKQQDDGHDGGTEPQPGPELNGDQQEAVAAVQRHAGFGAFVLDGVTGSGKTEVYLQLARRVLDAGRQVLVLVPEIGLTPQLVARLRARLGTEPVTLHSALSDLERLTAWRRARAGDAALVVGTRSAVFTPLPRLGLIVVDEEHDHSLKQQEGLRYSARDLAIARAKRADVPVVLGSATPSLELLHRCATGQYRRLALPDRAGGASPPVLRLVDLTRSPTTDGISEPLAAAITAHLAEEGQVLIFLNRRGYAPTLICTACGHVAECPRCDARMTVHAGQGRLRCHHCGAGSALPDSCPECGAAVRPLGEGTQRLEEALERRFPASRVTRIDSDSTQGKAAIDAALALAERGDTEILVGTQMLSKGHHFPRLTLVGVVNADQGLFGSDFRSAERLAQSIVQVAGRAGRENRRGEVLIQTAFPGNPFWRRLIDGGYAAVAGDALAEREAARWPPFTRLALLRAAAHRQGDAHAFLEVARSGIECRPESLRVLGPVDAPMARRAGRYHAQLLLQASDRRALHAALAALRPGLEEHPAGRKVRWSIDVDPIELF
jgi:primosomal protein N' (replication factor Y)